MFGRGRDWLTWLGLAVLVVGVIRGGLFVAIPTLPAPFAWGSALMLGLALVFLLRPLPHEALLEHRPPPQPPDAEPRR